MSEKNSFILNDESQVNAHGFILLNAGAKLDRFRSNPAMLFLHNQESIVGSWDNIRVEGAKLLADPVFDSEDPDSKKIEGKVNRGFLKGASLGININSAELREIPGIGYVPVVTSWEAMEASLCAVPSNMSALRLYNEKGELLTSAEAIKLSIDNLINKSKSDNQMEKILLTAEAATALKISKETELSVLNAAIVALAASKEQAENALKDHLKAQAKALLDTAIAEGRLTADKRESFETMALSNFKQAKDIIDSLPARQTFSDKTKKPGTSESGDREDWNYLRWMKEDSKGLAELSAKDPEKFAQLKASYSQNR